MLFFFTDMMAFSWFPQHNPPITHAPTHKKLHNSAVPQNFFSVLSASNKCVFCSKQKIASCELFGCQFFLGGGGYILLLKSDKMKKKKSARPFKKKKAFIITLRCITHFLLK